MTAPSADKEPVIVSYLEMLRAEDLNGKPPRDATFGVARADPPNAEVNRAMYVGVGGVWAWTDRLSWSDDAWRAYAERDELETWVATIDGQDAGYFELEHQPDGNVQIVFFGMLPHYTESGCGGALLTEALRRAWRIAGTQRVWVHTCTHDHPHALSNYRSRGMTVYRTEST